MVDVLVEFDYDAEQEDELTIRVGDVIKNVLMSEGGWWEGELNGKKGMFPDNFVKVKSNEPEKPKEEPKKDLLKSQQRSSVKELANKLGVIGGSAPPKKRESQHIKKRAKVLFDYEPTENEDELKIEVGQIVEITKQEEDGWWEGTLDGKTGVFPSNFVELIDDLEPEHQTEKNSSTEEKPKDSEIRGKKIMGVGLGNIFQGGPIKLRTTQGTQKTIEQGNKMEEAPAPVVKREKTSTDPFSHPGLPLTALHMVKGTAIDNNQITMNTTNIIDTVHTHVHDKSSNPNTTDNSKVDDSFNWILNVYDEDSSPMEEKDLYEYGEPSLHVSNKSIGNIKPRLLTAQQVERPVSEDDLIEYDSVLDDSNKENISANFYHTTGALKSVLSSFTSYPDVNRSHQNTNNCAIDLHKLQIEDKILQENECIATDANLSEQENVCLSEISGSWLHNHHKGKGTEKNGKPKPKQNKLLSGLMKLKRSMNLQSKGQTKDMLNGGEKNFEIQLPSNSNNMAQHGTPSYEQRTYVHGSHSLQTQVNVCTYEPGVSPLAGVSGNSDKEGNQLLRFKKMSHTKTDNCRSAPVLGAYMKSKPGEALKYRRPLRPIALENLSDTGWDNSPYMPQAQDISNTASPENTNCTQVGGGFEVIKGSLPQKDKSPTQDPRQETEKELPGRHSKTCYTADVGPKRQAKSTCARDGYLSSLNQSTHLSPFLKAIATRYQLFDKKRDEANVENKGDVSDVHMDKDQSIHREKELTLQQVTPTVLSDQGSEKPLDPVSSIEEDPYIMMISRSPDTSEAHVSPLKRPDRSHHSIGYSDSRNQTEIDTQELEDFIETIISDAQTEIEVNIDHGDSEDSEELGSNDIPDSDDSQSDYGSHLKDIADGYEDKLLRTLTDALNYDDDEEEDDEFDDQNLAINNETSYCSSWSSNVAAGSSDMLNVSFVEEEKGARKITTVDGPWVSPKITRNIHDHKHSSNYEKLSSKTQNNSVANTLMKQGTGSNNPKRDLNKKPNTGKKLVEKKDVGTSPISELLSYDTTMEDSQDLVSPEITPVKLRSKPRYSSSPMSSPTLPNGSANEYRDESTDIYGNKEGHTLSTTGGNYTVESSEAEIESISEKVQREYECSTKEPMDLHVQAKRSVKASQLCRDSDFVRDCTEKRKKRFSWRNLFRWRAKNKMPVMLLSYRASDSENDTRDMIAGTDEIDQFTYPDTRLQSPPGGSESTDKSQNTEEALYSKEESCLSQKGIHEIKKPNWSFTNFDLVQNTVETFFKNVEEQNTPKLLIPECCLDNTEDEVIKYSLEDIQEYSPERDAKTIIENLMSLSTQDEFDSTSEEEKGTCFYPGGFLNYTNDKIRGPETLFNLAWNVYHSHLSNNNYEQVKSDDSLSLHDENDIQLSPDSPNLILSMVNDVKKLNLTLTPTLSDTEMTRNLDSFLREALKPIDNLSLQVDSSESEEEYVRRYISLSEYSQDEEVSTSEDVSIEAQERYPSYLYNSQDMHNTTKGPKDNKHQLPDSNSNDMDISDADDDDDNLYDKVISYNEIKANDDDDEDGDDEVVHSSKDLSDQSGSSEEMFTDEIVAGSITKSVMQEDGNRYPKLFTLPVMRTEARKDESPNFNQNQAEGDSTLESLNVSRDGQSDLRNSEHQERVILSPNSTVESEKFYTDVETDITAEYTDYADEQNSTCERFYTDDDMNNTDIIDDVIYL